MARLYTMVALCGAVVMALEILSSRLLAPQFGNSVYVWGSIISVFLFSLSIGYYLGGRLADRSPHLSVLAKVILFAALGQSGVLLFGRQVVARLGEMTAGAPAGSLPAAALLFGPPSVLLAMVSPFMVRLAARDLGHLGDTAGRLYAVSTAGSLVGTLGCTFALIPFLDLESGLSLLLAITVGTSLIGLADQWRQHLGTTLLAALLPVHAATGTTLAPKARPGLVASRITPYQTLEVADRQGARTLRSDRVIHTSIRHSDGLSAILYPRYAAAALLFQPDLERVLVLGMGAGAVGTYLESVTEPLYTDYVDVDPAIPQIAERYFDFRVAPHRQVHVEDARGFLAHTEGSWDFIYSDTYVGRAIPFHLTTLEFFTAAQARLREGGVMGINLAAPLDRPFSRAIYRTVREVFPVVEAWRVPGGNTLLVAANEGLSQSRLLERAAELDGRLKLEPTLGTIMAARLHVDLDFEGVPVLVDDFAPVNWMVALDAAELRMP